MARSRNIKPGFFENEELAELDFGTRLLFIGLWTLADRDGYLEDRPKRIKMKLFPMDDFDVEAGLRNLNDAGFIQRYKAQGLPCIFIQSFSKHQNPHHKEKSSNLPKPETNLGQAQDNNGVIIDEKPEASTGQAQVEPSSSPADSLLLNPSSLNPDYGSPSEESAQEPKKPSTRGTRIPADWQLTDDWKSIAKQIRPDWPDNHVHRIADGFKDYWLAKTGKDATKADWLATWRNWCRNDKTQITGLLNGQHQNSFSGNPSKGNNRSSGSAFDKVMHEINAARQRDNREPMGNYDPAVRPQVDQQLRGGPGPDGGVGSVIEGDYTRND